MRNLKVMLAGLIVLSPMVASAAVIQTFDNGWYRDDGRHTQTNTNTYTGKIAGFEGRSFHAYDLSSIVGAVTSATVTFYANGQLRTDTGSETIQLFDFTSGIDALLNATGGTGAFNDLGTGASFGSYTITQSNFSAMPQFSITLNSFAVDAMNAALSSSDQRFVIGGALSTITGSRINEAFFSSSFGVPASFLTLDTTAVPEPGTLALLGLGLAGLGFAGRRKV